MVIDDQQEVLHWLFKEPIGPTLLNFAPCAPAPLMAVRAYRVVLTYRDVTLVNVTSPLRVVLIVCVCNDIDNFV